MTIKEKYLAWRLEHQLHFVVRVGVDLHLHRVHVLVLLCDAVYAYNKDDNRKCMRRQNKFLQCIIVVRFVAAGDSGSRVINMHHHTHRRSCLPAQVWYTRV